MIDAQAVEDGRLQIVHVDRIFGDVVSVVVGLAERDAGLDPAACHPDGKAAPVVVAAIVVGGEAALTIHGTSKLAAPDHQRVIEHSALLKIDDESSRSLVHIFAALWQFLWQVAMMIPVAVVELDVAHAALGQPADQQTIGGKGARFLRVFSVEIEGAGWLTTQVKEFRNRGL